MQIESNTSRMLWYAVLVFVLPIVLGIVGWVTVAQFTDQTHWQLLGGVGGFALTFVGVFLYSKILQKKQCDIEITEIVEKNVTAETIE